jgi:hypothetical protein
MNLVMDMTEVRGVRSRVPVGSAGRKGNGRG